MEGYLGEQIIEIEAPIPPTTWALHWLERYSQIDGEHRKTWVLDQVARILRGTPVIAKLASWENGTVEMRTRSASHPKPIDPGSRLTKMMASIRGTWVSHRDR